ncbi:TIGR03619 family F420-dependent LLM class oxidoreductase [Microbacterium sp. A588]
MQFAIGYPLGHLDPPAEIITQEAVAAIAVKAELSGISAISFTEHPATPDSWRDENGHDALDPFIGLSFAAAATRRIRLLTFLAVVPYHHPFILAKTTASLDRLSGGRLTLGVGTGYLQGEFEALGVPFGQRNRLFAESMEVIRLAWSGQPVDYAAPSFSAVGTVSRPTPLSSPRPPVWIGGNSSLTRRRVAQYGDGWMPIPTNAAQQIRRKTAQLESIEKLGAQIQELQEERERLGRLGKAEIKFMIQDIDPREELDRYIERVHQLHEIGVDWVALEVPGGSLSAALEHLEWFSAAVRPQLPTPPAPPALDPEGSDRRKIIDLYRTYGRALDQRRFELLREVFSHDVVADIAGDQIIGLDLLIDLMRHSHDGVVSMRHRALDFDIEITGDTASARVAKRNTLTREGGESEVYAGRYSDKLVRMPVGWRINQRSSQQQR